MKEGRCRYFIDERSYDVEAGDIVFIPKGVIHRAHYFGQIHSRLLINCTEQYIPEVIQNSIDETRFIYRSKEIAKQAEKRLEKVNKDITVAIMGCVVNGPGEASAADIGIAGGDGCGVIFKKGEIIRRLPENELLDALLEEIEKM